MLGVKLWDVIRLVLILIIVAFLLAVVTSLVWPPEGTFE